MPSAVKEVSGKLFILASYLVLTLLLVTTVGHFTVYLVPLGRRVKCNHKEHLEPIQCDSVA